MKRILLVLMGLAAVLLLSGCTAVSYEHYRRPKDPYAVYGPPCEIVEVIEVPVRRPRGHRHHRHPHPWR